MAPTVRAGGPRPQGTDGTDFRFRQTIENSELRGCAQSAKLNLSLSLRRCAFPPWRVQHRPTV